MNNKIFFLSKIFFDEVNMNFLDYNLRYNHFHLFHIANNYHVFLKVNLTSFNWTVS